MEVSSDSILVDIQQILFGQFSGQLSQLDTQNFQNSDFSNIFEDLIPEISQLSSAQMMQLPAMAIHQQTSDYINRQQATAPTTNIASLSNAKLNLNQPSNVQGQLSNISANQTDTQLLETSTEIDQLLESPITSLRQANVDGTFIEKLERVNLEQQLDQQDVNDSDNFSEELFELSDLKHKTNERQDAPGTKHNLNFEVQQFISPQEELDVANNFKLNADVLVSDKKALNTEQFMLNTTSLTNTSDIQTHSLDIRASVHKADIQTNHQLLPLAADQDFAENFAEQMQMMINSKKQQAQIQLEPVELGKLEVQITNTKQNEYVVNIVAQSDQAQQFLEQNASRLKENFTNQELQFSFSKEQDQSSDHHKDLQHDENKHLDFNQDSNQPEDDIMRTHIAAYTLKQASSVNIFA